MKKINSKWFTIILLSLIFITIIAFVNKENNSIITGESELDAKITKKEIKEDRNKMIDIMESTHPIFLEEVPKEYEEAKNKFIKDTKKEMTIGEFQLALSKYTSSIEDGHTMVYFKGANSLDINWKYIDKNLVLLDDSNKPTNKIVTSINNVSVEEIIKVIDETFPAENYVYEYVNNSSMSKEKLVLISAGVDTSKDIILSIKEGKSNYEMKVEFNGYDRYNKSNHDIYAKNIDESTAYIKLGICKVNDSLKKVISYLNNNLDNLKNVIIDVRDNPGGDSTACEMILESLKIKAGGFGGVKRYSKLVNEMYPEAKSSGYETFKRSNDVVKNEDIKLYVLMNEKTFSSAQWLATVVSDGELGTLVGKPSRNTPSSFGNIIPFMLKNSKIQGQISFVKWLRPDETKDSQKVLEPHIRVEDGEDALEKTLELIKE
ncbi:S41 family peptidase [[Clostridium] dakarense]|uniref:S41 family peptidase n=1 Tax=Faecalimicrobium dakarense TaxID=1301100 RepID=UPI0004AC9772|nr:S41 family peptidase [[Clostridium] dakarense]